MLLTRNRFIIEQDTPSSYSGQTGLFTRVNAAEDALEFVAVAGATTHDDLTGVTSAQHHNSHLPQLINPNANKWSKPGWQWISITAPTLVADRLYYVPIFVERSTTFVRIGVNVEAAIAATVVRLGIYASTFDGNGQLTPDTLTLDAGTVSSATTGDKEIVINQTLAEGFHFLAFSSDGAVALPGADEQKATFGPVSGNASAVVSHGSVVVAVDVVDGAAALPDPATTPTSDQFARYAIPSLRI